MGGRMEPQSTRKGVTAADERKRSETILPSEASGRAKGAAAVDGRSAVRETKAKRVLVAGVNVLARRKNGGWEGPASHWRILELFAENLEDSSHAVLVDVGRQGPRAEMDLALGERWKMAPLNRLAPTGLSRLLESAVMERRLKRLVAEYDYCHIRLPSWVGLAAWRAARRSSTPYWVSLHADWAKILATYEEDASNVVMRGYYGHLRRRVERVLPIVVRGARAVFSVAECLQARWAANHPHSVVFNDTTHEADDVWSLRETFSGDKTTLLFVGEVSHAKGVDVLVEAAELLSAGGLAVEVNIVGKGPLTKALEEKAAKSSVRINLRGWIPQGPALDAEFELADALILPSQNEGTPRVLVEALTRATPIVASAVGDVAHLLGNGERGWLVQPGSPEEIVAAVREMRADADGRTRRIRAGLNYSRTYDRRHWVSVIRQGLHAVDPLVLSRGSWGASGHSADHREGAPWN